MLQQQKNRYLENTVQTATPAQLLIMLYDGAIRYCKLAIEAIKSTNIQEANHNLVRAQDIISELIITLDRSLPISDSIYKLYEYFQHLLVQANMKKSEEPIQEVIGYLVELKETWIQASRSLLAAQSGVRTHG